MSKRIIGGCLLVLILASIVTLYRRTVVETSGPSTGQVANDERESNRVYANGETEPVPASNAPNHDPTPPTNRAADPNPKQDTPTPNHVEKTAYDAGQPPMISCDGGSLVRVSAFRPPQEKRWTGRNPCLAEPDFLKSVHGSVYVRDGKAMVPARGALVYDREGGRTFTDEVGRFRFEASCTPKGDGHWSCNLNAAVLGFQIEAPAGGFWYKDSDFAKTEGATLVLRKNPDTAIEIIFANPELAPDRLEVTMGVRPYAPRAGDEGVYVVVESRSGSRVELKGPIALFGLLAVSGKGCRVAANGLEQRAEKPGVTTWRITLERCDNFPARGRVSDLRDGLPLSCAVVTGVAPYELSLTDDSGAFTLWLSRDPRDHTGKLLPWTSQVLTVSSVDHLGVSRPADPFQQMPPEFGLATVNPGGTCEGPWEVSLRPLVSANLTVAIAGFESTKGGQIFFQCADMVDNQILQTPVRVPPSGSVTLKRVPWGVVKFKFQCSGLEPAVSALQISDECWHSNEPYRLIAEAVK